MLTNMKYYTILIACFLVNGIESNTQTFLADTVDNQINVKRLADRPLGVCLTIRGGEDVEEYTSTLENSSEIDSNDATGDRPSELTHTQASSQSDNDIPMEVKSVEEDVVDANPGATTDIGSVNVEDKADAKKIDEKVMTSNEKKSSLDDITTNEKKTKPFIRETIQKAQRKGVEKMKANIADLKKKHFDFHKRIFSNEGLKNVRSNYVGIQSKVNYAFDEAINLSKRVLASFLLIVSTVFYTILPYFSNQKQPMTNLALLVFTLLGSSLGFFSFLYFISVGYGVGIALPALYALIAFNHPSSSLEIPMLTNIHTGLVFIWGVRLAIFLLHREFVNWKEWNVKVKEVNQRSKITSKFSVWMSCAFFYASLLLPNLYRMRQAINVGTTTSNSVTVEAAAAAAAAIKEPDLDILWGDWGKTGIILQMVGLLIETVADYQKATFKASFTSNSSNSLIATSNRNKWCNEGLWKYFTHPNYLGDAIFWIGTFLAGLGAMETTMQYILSTLGILGIFIVLLGATEQLDKKQWIQYRKNPKYVEYVNNVGFMGPKWNKSKKSIKGNKKMAT